MRVIVGPHECILSPPFHQAADSRIAEERGIDLFGHVFARQFLHIDDSVANALSSYFISPNDPGQALVSFTRCTESVRHAGGGNGVQIERGRGLRRGAGTLDGAGFELRAR